MANFIGLYYPFIHFKNEAWLKTMALYWDSIKRIVPAEYQLRDSVTVAKLADSGLIENVLPHPDDEWPVRDSFVQFLENNAARLRGRYGVDQLENWAEDPITAKWAPNGSDRRLAYVHIQKMWPALTEALKQTGLAKVGRASDERWLGMHPKLANVYMTTLAEHMTNGKGWNPITDETLDQLAVSGFSIERVSRALLDDLSLAGEEPMALEARVALANLCFESVIPHGVANVPVDTIIKLRLAHRTEFNAFQDGLAAFRDETEKLDGITDQAALTELLSLHYAKTIAPSVKEVRKAFQMMNVETATSIVNVNFAVPATLAAAANYADLAMNPVLAGISSVALGLIPTIQKKREEAEAALKKPGAWLLRVEEGLKPATFLSWVQQGARKFVIGA